MRQRTLGGRRKLLQRVLSCEDRAIRKDPRGIALYFFVDADLRLTLSIRIRAFYIWKVLRSRTEQCLGTLTMRAPEGAVKDGAATLEALGEGIELIGSRRDHKRGEHAEDNEQEEYAPKDKDASLHRKSIAPPENCYNAADEVPPAP